MGSRNEKLQAAAGEGKAAEAEAQSNPAEAVGSSIADDNTMTVYGQTVGEIVTTMQIDVDRITGESTAKDKTIAKLQQELAEAIAANTRHANTIRDFGVELAVAKLVATDAKKVAQHERNFQVLPEGGIRLVVNLDVDESTPLLSWADSAGEDPGTYIARQIKDALVAVTSS